MELKKKKICLESQNFWENVNSHTPLSLGLARISSLLNAQTACGGPIWGTGCLWRAYCCSAAGSVGGRRPPLRPHPAPQQLPGFLSINAHTPCPRSPPGGRCRCGGLRGIGIIGGDLWFEPRTPQERSEMSTLGCETSQAVLGCWPHAGPTPGGLDREARLPIPAWARAHTSPGGTGPARATARWRL